jgi:hypothetical protein
LNEYYYRRLSVLQLFNYGDAAGNKISANEKVFAMAGYSLIVQPVQMLN